MTILHHLAQAAAMLLLLELLVVVLIFLGIAGGLGFGLHWVRGKVGWASSLANRYLALGKKYIHIGTDYAAKPVIMASGFADTVKATAEALRHRFRQIHAERTAQTQPSIIPAPAAVPVEPPSDDTVAVPRIP